MNADGRPGKAANHVIPAEAAAERRDEHPASSSRGDTECTERIWGRVEPRMNPSRQAAAKVGENVNPTDGKAHPRMEEAEESS